MAHAAKEYLNQIGILDLKINQRTKEQYALQQLARSTSRTIEPKCDCSNKDKAGNAIVRYVEIEEEIDNMIDDFVELKHKIIGEIQSITKPEYIDLLYKRYVERKKIEMIAVEMDFSYYRTRHMHTEALDAFKKMVLD